jgi:ATP-binding cassette subfamily B multidrug efflux pump
VSAGQEPQQAKAPGKRAEQALARFHEEGALQSYDLRNLARLWPFVRPYRLQLLASIGLLLVASGFASRAPSS